MAFSIYGQKESTAQIKEISSDACNCISEIKVENSKKNDAIKDCISKSMIKVQKSDKEDSKSIDFGSESFKKIQNYVVENCVEIKNILLTENENFKHATSSNVLAQLAYDDGMDYMHDKDYKSAILKFKKATDIDPYFAFAWDNLGVSYRKTNQYKKAIEAYKKSLKINPKGRLPLMNIAVVYNLNKEYKLAIKYYTKFIHNFREDPEGYYGLGLVQYTNNMQEEGLDNLIHAYTIYTAQNSPYGSDAAKKIGYMYNDLKNQNKQDIFNRVAKKYNLSIESN